MTVFISVALSLAAGQRASADVRLIDATRREDAAAVRALLQQKLDVSAPQPDGATALLWAANRNNLEIAGLLVAAGAKVDAANDYGATPLLLAAENGSAAMIELLLKAGASPNLPSAAGDTPLMSAARSGSLGAVRALLDKHADVNAAEPVDGQTALLWALSEQHLPVVQALVAAGANVQQASKAGFTPLMMAARFANLDEARLLLDRGARINDVTAEGVSVLMVAVLRGHSAFARFLMDRGADPNIDKAGYTALHWAAGKWESSMTHDYPTTTHSEWRYLGGVPEGKLELVQALVAHGADVNARLKTGPPRYGINLFNPTILTGATPFFIAALSADAEMMKVLVALGADPLATAGGTATALMAASGLGRVPGDSLITDEASVDAVNLCLDLGLDVNAANAQGETALHGSAYYGNPKVAQRLVERGANMEARNKRGDTPLKVSLGYSQSAMVLTRPEISALLRKLGAKE